jgi:cyclopropane-fatty-acyl-phospholipid synthase
VILGQRDHAAGRSLAFVQELLGGYRPRDFAVRLWDGTVWEPDDGEEARFTLVLRHPGALRALLGPPSELALAEAYVRGDFELEGDVEAAFRVADYLLVDRPSSRAATVRQAARLLALPSDGGPGAEHAPARLRGARFSLGRDREAVTYHYDRSNEFFALWLDERMVYSVAYFASEEESLEAAQLRKLDLVCRKLRLRPGERLLDIGCGWGALVVHAAARFGVEALGVTLSEKQAGVARAAIERAGVGDRCRIEVRDYRSLEEAAGFDKLASVGMFEHIPADGLGAYFAQAWRLLRPGGVFLNHGIARPLDQPQRRGRSFVTTYVYPDAELTPLSTVLRLAEAAGFEVRDVESLREHYPLTLRAWLGRLEAQRDAAVHAASEATYRIFRIYLAGSAHGFATGRLNVYQSLLVKPADGRSGLPLTRDDWYG